MAEKEYIERDMMSKFIELFYVQHSDNEVFTKELLQYFIGNFPASNAVPVVRCKDCKHCEGCEGYDMAKYCNAWEHSVLPDWYCSYGERRENHHG